MTTRLMLFAVSNLTITLGYVFLSAYVVPRIAVRLTRTKIGGAGFFLLCGLHHLDNVYHALFQGQQSVRGVSVQLHMLMIDVPQAVFIWMFVSGLYVELVRWGPWATDANER